MTQKKKKKKISSTVSDEANIYIQIISYLIYFIFNII